MGKPERKGPWWAAILSSKAQLRLHRDDVASTVCRVLGLDENDVTGPCRKRELGDARRIIAHYAVRNLDLSLTEAGNLIGGRTHSTVLSAIGDHDVLMSSDKAYREKYQAFMREVEGR